MTSTTDEWDKLVLAAKLSGVKMAAWWEYRDENRQEFLIKDLVKAKPGYARWVTWEALTSRAIRSRNLAAVLAIEEIKANREAIDKLFEKRGRNTMVDFDDLRAYREWYSS